MSDEIMLTIGEDGKASLYDDTYDITIHCESKEEQEEVRKLLENPEPHWIPVTERLPKESGLYQVTDMQGNVVRYVFNANEGSVEYWRRCVKAWMPLPEPYKGVTDGRD